MWDDDPGDYELIPDEDDETLTVTCPGCGAAVYEDAEQCPVCGDWITRSNSVWEGKPLWWVALGFIGIILTSLVLLMA